MKMFSLLSKLRLIYWVLLITGLVGSLILPQSVLGQQNEILLEQAIRNGQITVTFRGIAPDGRFAEPMVQLDLTNETSNQLTIIISQGLTLASNNPTEADVIVLGENVLLDPNQSLSVGLFAYSLEHTKRFPTSTTEYQLEEIEISSDLMNTLENINTLGTRTELDSQIAVWLVHQNLPLERLEADLNVDFSGFRDRVSQIRGDSNNTWWIWGGISLLIISIFSILVVIWWWSSRKSHWFWQLRQRNQLINNLDDYERVRDGSMAEVLTAYDKRKKPPRQVVVKFPRSEGIDPKRRESIVYRFENEILSQRQLKHQNIVKLLDYGKGPHYRTKEKTPYLVQEFIDGVTVEQLLKQHKRPLREPIIFEITTQILNALDHIHSKEFVHRDLTWSNVMIDKTGQVYLIDFGNATYAGSNYTYSVGLQAFATPPFGAPEIGKRIPADKRTDFYSLAVVMYAMYGGQINKHITRIEIIENLNKLADISSQVKQVLSRCLNQEIADRGYSNVSELRKALGLPRGQLTEIVQGKRIDHTETQPP